MRALILQNLVHMALQQIWTPLFYKESDKTIAAVVRFISGHPGTRAGLQALIDLPNEWRRGMGS